MQLTTDLNNCDIEYVQKPISPVLSKPQEAQDAMQSSQITNEAMKENVIRELLETEENYVKLLSSLCVGYETNEILSSLFPLFSREVVENRNSEIMIFKLWLSLL